MIRSPVVSPVFKVVRSLPVKPLTHVHMARARMGVLWLLSGGVWNDARPWADGATWTDGG